MFETQSAATKAAVDILSQQAESAVAGLQLQLEVSQASLSGYKMQVEDLKAKLAAELLVLQFVEGQGYDPIVNDVLNKALATWSPRVGPNIGGEAPTKYSMTRGLDGKLILSVTGTPPTKNPDGTYTKHWCDVLWANKRPPLPSGVTDFALDFGVVPIASGDVASDQCLEFDTLCLDNGFEYNLSSQYVRSSGKIQIANGTTKGGWLDSGVVLPSFDLTTRHTFRWVYKVDRVAKNCQYVALIVDGKRFDVASTQPAYSQPSWSNQLTLQLQQDVNSTGGSFTSVFDSIKYIY